MPRRGASPSRSARITRHNTGAVTYRWNGQRSLQGFQQILEAAFATTAERAASYWHNEEWTKDRHPYMTGNEKSMKANGFFRVKKMRAMVVGLEFGTTAPWAKYEEFGTGRRAAHHPIRNTLDRVGYRVSDYIRNEARRRGIVLAGGTAAGTGGAPAAGGHGTKGKTQSASAGAQPKPSDGTTVQGGAAAPKTGFVSRSRQREQQYERPISHWQEVIKRMHERIADEEREDAEEEE